MILLQSQPKLSGVSVIALFANRLQINLIELGLEAHLLVAGGAREVVDTPCLVQRREHVTLDHLVACVAKVTKELVVVSLTIGQTLPFIMPVSKEGFLTLCTDKVFNVPMFPEGCHHSLLDGSSACSTDGNAHFVMASEAVELVELVGSVPGAGAHLACTAGQLNATACAVEVVWMVDLPPEPQGIPINGAVALLAHVLPNAIRLHLGVALMAQSSALIFDESQVGQLLVTHLAREALCMPGGLHSLDNSADDEFATFLAAWREQHMKVVLTVLAPLELVEHAVGERSETLGAHKTLGVEQLPI